MYPVHLHYLHLVSFPGQALLEPCFLSYPDFSDNSRLPDHVSVHQSEVEIYHAGLCTCRYASAIDYMLDLGTSTTLRRASTILSSIRSNRPIARRNPLSLPYSQSNGHHSTERCQPSAPTPCTYAPSDWLVSLNPPTLGNSTACLLPSSWPLDCLWWLACQRKSWQAKDEKLISGHVML